MKAKSIFLILLLITLSLSVTKVYAAVTLVYFTAKTVDLKVILEWETASEIDMLYFVLLRSDQENGNYSQIGDFIYTQGSSVSGLIYQYVDSDVTLNKTYYYKLEAVDENYQSQFYGPLSITVRIATFTNTVTPSKTMTVTGTLTPNTPTMTSTITPTRTLNQTRTETPTRSPTSPFSFVTNTNTPSPTVTRRPSRTPTVPPITPTYEFTRTFEIVTFHSSTPSVTITTTPPAKAPATPIRRGVVGFIITFSIGTLILCVLFILQRKHRTD